MSENNKKILVVVSVLMLIFSVSYLLFFQPKDKPQNNIKNNIETAQVQTTTKKTKDELNQELSESEIRERDLLSELKKVNEEIASKNDIQSINPLLVKRDSLIQSISDEDDLQTTIKLEIEAGQ